MESFIISHDLNYIIYGAGGDGIKLSQVLSKAKIKIWGYIDGRAKSIGTVKGYNVFTLEEASEIISNKKNFIIIITVKNLFEHTPIARKLASVGFTQIIYKPLEVLQGMGNETQMHIGQAYDILILKKKMPMGMELEETDSQVEIVCKDNFFLLDDSDWIIAWVPVEMIHNYDDNQDAYGRISMTAFFPLVDLYRLFMGQYVEREKAQKVIDNFIYYSMEWMNKNEVNDNPELRKSLIRSRSRVFGEMQRRFEREQDFFIRSAPTVVRRGGGILFNTFWKK